MPPVPRSPQIDYVHVVDKVWGREEIIVNNDLYGMKILHIRPGFRSSRHSHKIKQETFFVWEGEVSVEVEGIVTHMVQGESITIHPGEVHSFWVSRDQLAAVVLESSTHHSDDDVYRLSPSRAISLVCAVESPSQK